MCAGDARGGLVMCPRGCRVITPSETTASADWLWRAAVWTEVVRDRGEKACYTHDSRMVGRFQWTMERLCLSFRKLILKYAA